MESIESEHRQVYGPVLILLAVLTFWVSTVLLISSVSGENYTEYCRAHHTLDPGISFFYPRWIALALCVGFSIGFPIYLYRHLPRGGLKFLTVVGTVFALFFSDLFAVFWCAGAAAETSTGDRIYQPLALFFLVLASISAGVAAIAYRALRAKMEVAERDAEVIPLIPRKVVYILVVIGILLVVAAFVAESIHIDNAYRS